MMNSYYNEDLPLYKEKKHNKNKCRYCIIVIWGISLVISFFGGFWIKCKNLTSLEELR